jgi:hypothetical protein
MAKSVIKYPAIKPGQARRDTVPPSVTPVLHFSEDVALKIKHRITKVFVANKNRNEHNAY